MDSASSASSISGHSPGRPASKPAATEEMGRRTRLKLACGAKLKSIRSKSWPLAQLFLTCHLPCSTVAALLHLFSSPCADSIHQTLSYSWQARPALPPYYSTTLHSSQSQHNNEILSQKMDQISRLDLTESRIIAVSCLQTCCVFWKNIFQTSSGTVLTVFN